MLAYYNGEYLPLADIRISPDDRGFLFADGVYDVIRAYNGRLFRLDDHLARLSHGASQLRLAQTDFSFLAKVAQRLLTVNGLTDAATVYFQITRGCAQRGHAFPQPPPPVTIYGAARPLDEGRLREQQQRGITAITVSDNRWARCDIKTTALIANVMANQEAAENGAGEAIFIRDGALLEGSHSSVMAVLDGELRAAPLSNYILPGITRKAVLELCRELAIPVREMPVFQNEIPKLTELMVLGTTSEVTPVIALDGKPVGAGLPGAISRRLSRALRDTIERFRG
ncbi:MAG: aminotransferase class IV [Desulfobulbaceae bacterium]|jgi:D-alanine transaminase|nr:aminotransferase class IV [Desulfobulbaceae bacterium]